MDDTGRIELFFGCMWSGKSTELIRQAKRYSNINKNIIIINHSSDIRYGKNIVSTHDHSEITCLSLNNLELLKQYKEYRACDIILIDEGQFFNDLFNFSVHAADIDKKTIIVFGLDGDYKKEAFGDILKLIPHSEKVTKLNAFCQICKDGTLASFTKRLIDSDKQEIIGNEDSYMAVCRKHYDMNLVSEGKQLENNIKFY